MTFFDRHLEQNQRYEQSKLERAKERTILTPEVKRKMEETYIEGTSKGLSREKSAELAGYTGRKLRTPRKLIETPELKARMQESLIRKRVTLDVIADTVAKGMKANVLHANKERVVETEIADHGERRKAAEAAARLWGLGERASAEAGGNTITLTLAGPLAERIAARMAGVNVPDEHS